MGLTLAQALGFTEADLVANRGGHFSEAQREDLEPRLAYYRNAMERSWGWLDPASKGRRSRAIWASTSLFVLVLGVATYVSRPAGAAGPDALLDLALTVGGCVAMLAAARFYVAWLIRIQRAPDELVLHTAEGPVAHGSEAGSGWGAGTLTVTVGGVALPVSDAVQACFAPGRSYRVYYTKAPFLLLLSAEPITA